MSHLLTAIIAFVVGFYVGAIVQWVHDVKRYLGKRK